MCIRDRYKTHRVAVVDGGTAVEDAPADLNTQVPVIIEALAALGIPRWGAAHYEADDVIGTLVARAHGTQPVDVVTGDRDLFQLVDDAARIRVLYTARGGEMCIRDSIQGYGGTPWTPGQTDAWWHIGPDMYSCIVKSPPSATLPLFLVGVPGPVTTGTGTIGAWPATTWTYPCLLYTSRCV